MQQWPIPAVLAKSPGSGPTSCAHFRALGDPEFGFTPCDNLGNLGARDEYCFRLHLLRYPETIEDAGEIVAARTSLGGIRIND
jgi:hypothetical protein